MHPYSRPAAQVEDEAWARVEQATAAERPTTEASAHTPTEELSEHLLSRYLIVVQPDPHEQLMGDYA